MALELVSRAMTCHQVAELKYWALISKISIPIGILSLSIKNRVLREAAKELKVIPGRGNQDGEKRQDVGRRTFENQVMFLGSNFFFALFCLVLFRFLCLNIAGLTLTSTEHLLWVHLTWNTVIHFIQRVWKLDEYCSLLTYKKEKKNWSVSEPSGTKAAWL